MIVADYMPPPWWFLPAMFWPLWVSVTLCVLVGGLINFGRWLERRKK